MTQALPSFPGIKGDWNMKMVCNRRRNEIAIAEKCSMNQTEDEAWRTFPPKYSLHAYPGPDAQDSLENSSTTTTPHECFLTDIDKITHKISTQCPCLKKSPFLLFFTERFCRGEGKFKKVTCLVLQGCVDASILVSEAWLVSLAQLPCSTHCLDDLSVIPSLLLSFLEGGVLKYKKDLDFRARIVHEELLSGF